MVEDVGNLRAKPDADSLRQGNGLEQRERYGLRARSRDTASTGVSESSNGITGIGKCRRIDPLVDRLTGIRTDSRNGIRAASVGVVDVVATAARVVEE